MSATHQARGRWASGEKYEPFIGRWSRLVAREFLGWLGVPPDRDWLDVGCGTGALSEAIVEQGAPRSLRGIDPSDGFVAYALAHVRDPRVRFEVGDAQAIPAERASVDAAVSGLVLNFVPQPERAAAEMARVTKPGGVVAAYVWDYTDGMQMLRHFWDAVHTLDPDVPAEDFPLCRRGALAKLFESAGLRDVESRAIEVPTRFQDFDDYWTPFLGGQGPAPSYVVSLDHERQTILRDFVRSRLPKEKDGSIRLTARAWAVRGRVARFEGSSENQRPLSVT